MKIESKLRRDGGTKVELGDVEYHFVPGADGREVCEVIDEDHIGILLGIREGYGVYKAGVAEKAPEPPPPPLAGNDGGADNHDDGDDGAGDGGESKPAGDLHVKHVGRGTYAVFDGETRLTAEPMSKEEAEKELTVFQSAQV